MKLHSQGSETLPICPSFSSYSAEGFAEKASEIAAGEYHHLPEQSPPFSDSTDDLYDYGFEFSLVQRDDLNLNLTPDKMFQVQEAFYPIFNRDLLQNRLSHEKADSAALLVPFEKLVVEDREEHDVPSSSESESDIEETSPRMFCVWMPQVVPASPSRCKKSSSTGSSSKTSWKLRDLLLHRSNSEGKSKGNIMVQAPKKKKEGKAGKVQSFKQQHEEFYVQNRSSKEMQRRKSFLPYRQGLVGFFTQVNGL